jgi:hypothetical protein
LVWLDARLDADLGAEAGRISRGWRRRLWRGSGRRHRPRRQKKCKQQKYRDERLEKAVFHINSLLK